VKSLLISTLAIWMALTASTSADASAAKRRALIVGSNAAPAGQIPLRYAHHDARKVYDVLVELAGVERDDARLLLEPSASQLRVALGMLRSEVQAGEQVFFYYSGHADERGLLLGRDVMSQTEIREFLRDERAQVRVAILDAGKSGAVSTAKGGVMRAGVDIEWAVDPAVKGAVLITSSTAEEASVERDDLGGSLFSHFLVSGLRGAADDDQDRTVTLEEVFGHAYENTLARSAESRSGYQHPTYEYRIAGQKQLVVTRLEMPSYMSFGYESAGSYVVFDRSRGHVVAELSKEPGTERKLWLPTGDYYIKKRLPNSVLMQKVGLTKGEAHRVRDHEMHTVPYEEDVTKGLGTGIFKPSWKYGAPYVNRTAHTLRRGELSLGMHAFQVGVSDEVTLEFAILPLIFQSVGMMTKIKLVHHDWFVWSMRAGLLQSFNQEWGAYNGRTYHALQAGTIFSADVASGLTLTLSTDWMLESAPDIVDEDYKMEWEIQVAAAGASLTWALGEHDLLQAYGQGSRIVRGGDQKDLVGQQDWGAHFFYAHSFGKLRIGAGVERGVVGGDKLVGGEKDWIPVIDAWWRW